MNEHIVELKGMGKTYMMGKVEIKALAGLNLNIEKGDFVAISGPSGAGKSTLLHIIGCLDSPTSGTVSINGKELGSMKDKELTNFR